MKPGTTLRHKATGKIVEFTGRKKGHRGVIKIETRPLELFGYLDINAFEVLPEWTLKSSPRDYVKRAESGQKVNEETLELARKYLG